MDVICEKCNTKIKIPDNKIQQIPAGQVFSIACPKCKNKISVENKAGPSPSKNAPAKPAPSQEKPAANETADSSSDSAATGSPFGFLEEGAKTAILCEPDAGIREKMKAVLENMEYHISAPPSPREALKQMRAHEFQVVVLNELFGTRDPDMNHVLKYIEQLLMSSRRNMFVTLLSNRLPSLDRMTAFNKSVNVIINLKEIDNFEKYFTHTFNDNKSFYRVFMESLVKIKD